MPKQISKKEEKVPQVKDTARISLKIEKQIARKGQGADAERRSRAAQAKVDEEERPHEKRRRHALPKQNPKKEKEARARLKPASPCGLCGCRR